MILKPQDILVLLKLVVLERSPRSYHTLAVDLEMSPSEVHGAVQRAITAKLAMREQHFIVPNISNLEEFLWHGIKYVFVPERGQMTRGMPTGFSAPPLASKLTSVGDPAQIWPDAEGEVRGEAFSPLYKSVPKAAKKDAVLYELLVLVDAIRGGRARERSIAWKELHQRLECYAEIRKS